MLVLTRKLGEVVCVGRDVEIMVVAVNSGKVRLGFRAPRDVVIQRSEVASRAKPAESDALPAHRVLPRADRDEFAATPPLRAFRQLESV
jgi:carbon storage regulator